MTPLSNPDSSQEQKYKTSHQKNRSLIERAFGILKSHWRILDHTGGHLGYSPERVSKIVMTCCALHNICRRIGLEVFDSDPIVQLFSEQEGISSNPTQQYSAAGIAHRQRLMSLIDS